MIPNDALVRRGWLKLATGALTLLLLVAILAMWRSG
jgi:hypothetical protein